MLTFYLSLLETDEQRNKFEQIYAEYTGLMYHVSLGIIKDPHLAEDCVHETFLRIIRTIDEVRVDNRKELKQYLLLLTRHCTIDHIRKLDRERPETDNMLEQHINTTSPDPEDIVLNAQVFERAVQAIQSLSDLYRVPLTLKLQGYRIKEIAVLLAVTENAVKQRIHRARTRVQAALEDKDGEQGNAHLI